MEFKRARGYLRLMERRRFGRPGVGIGVGVTLGAVVGAAFDNVGVGIALGVVLGVIYAGAVRRQRSDP